MHLYSSIYIQYRLIIAKVEKKKFLLLKKHVIKCGVLMCFQMEQHLLHRTVVHWEATQKADIMEKNIFDFIIAHLPWREQLHNSALWCVLFSLSLTHTLSSTECAGEAQTERDMPSGVRLCPWKTMERQNLLQKREVYDYSLWASLQRLSSCPLLLRCIYATPC